MSLFSLLNPKKPAYTDTVWRTRTAAIKGMIMEALLAIKQNQVPVVFSYFEDRTNEVISFLTTEGVPYFHVNKSNLGETTNKSNVVIVCPVSLISSSPGTTGFLNPLSAKHKFQFLFDGHYPLPSRELKVIEMLSS